MASLRVALVAPLLAGCSLIYNPSNLPDPRVIDAALLDTNPCALVIDEVAPKVIDEGQGAAGSAPALVVLHGNNIVNANLKIELKAKDGSTVHLSPVTDAVASTDHTYAAFTLTADVDTQLGTAGPVSVPLDITVSQDAPADGGCMSSATFTLSGKLALQGLPELTGKSTINALDDKYSKVDLAAVTFGGAVPAVVRAVSSIHITTAHADAAMTAAGPGGNTGTTSMGACPTAGGGGDTGKDANLSTLIANGGGGGGGGGATAGVAGSTGSNGRGGTGGAAGIKNGNDVMAALDSNAACAGGGGGLGGTLILTNPGGAGGGGGGTLVLAAGGDVSATTITAVGGTGVKPAAGGGGGGGGAGGNVLVHSDTGTLAIGAIDVAAGGGGDPGGGGGARGRVRWDAPVGAAPGGTSHRGASFAPLTARMFTTASPDLMIKGTSGDGFASRVIDAGGQAHDLGHVSVNAGLAVVTPALSPGFNRVCITLDGGAQEHAEADTCVDVAFLP